MIYTVLKGALVVPVHVDVRGPKPVLFVGMSAHELDTNQRQISEWRALLEVPGQPYAGLPLYGDHIRPLVGDVEDHEIQAKLDCKEWSADPDNYSATWIDE